MAVSHQIPSVVLVGFVLLATAVNTQDLIDICRDSMSEHPGEKGMQGVIGVRATTVPSVNPCIMRIETCSDCRISIEPDGKEFSLLGCDKAYDFTGKRCPSGCQYLYIFDQFYKNLTMTIYKDSSHQDWQSAFESESSVLFVGYCNGKIPLHGPIQLQYTIHAKEKYFRGSSALGITGDIKTPFFPDLYSLNSEYYYYIIESDSTLDHVYIIFTDWDLAFTSGLFIQMGETEDVYRSTSDRPALMAKSNRVRLVFDTGYEYQHGVLRSNLGFRAKYQFINPMSEMQPVPSTHCGAYKLFVDGGELELDTSSTINYRTYDCVWVVRTQPGYTHTLLNILKFSINPTNYMASENYLEIYGGLSSSGRFLTRIRSDSTITQWQYKHVDGFYVHLYGQFGLLDTVKLSFVSLNMEQLCSSANDLWRCNNGYCIPYLFKCDGVDHCGDRSDEQYGCSGTGSPWQKSSQQTVTLSVVIPVVISIFLLLILFVLFLLVRRYRRTRRNLIRREIEGLPSISEDLSHPHGRRRRRRNQGDITEDLPPAYEEAIQSPPMYPHMNLDPPGPGHWMLPKPPPYSEAIATPQEAAIAVCPDVSQPVPVDSPILSNSSSDSSESEQWESPRMPHLTDDSSDASPPTPARDTIHSYSTSYSSESSFESPHTPRHVRYAVSESDDLYQRTDRSSGDSSPGQDGDGRPAELPIRPSLIPYSDTDNQSNDIKQDHTEQPVMEQDYRDQSNMEQNHANRPEMEQNHANRPDMEQNHANRPDMERNHANRPEMEQNHANRPDMEQNHANRPDMERNHANRPEMEQYHANRPDMEQNHANRPDMERNHINRPDIVRNHANKPERNRINRPDNERNHTNRPDNERNHTNRPDMERNHTNRADIERNHTNRPDMERNHTNRADIERNRTNRPDIVRNHRNKSDMERNHAHRQEMEQDHRDRSNMEPNNRNRPGGRHHRIGQSDQLRHGQPRERQDRRPHRQDRPPDRQRDRHRGEVRRNLFKPSKPQSPHKLRNESLSVNDKEERRRHLPRVDEQQIHNGRNVKAKLSSLTDVMRQTRDRQEEETKQSRAQQEADKPRSRSNQYHTSMPNITEPAVAPRPGFQSLSNFSSAGVVVEDESALSGNIQPRHREYAKSLENISQATGSQGLRPFPFDGDLDPTGAASRKSWSPKNHDDGWGKAPSENPGSQEGSSEDRDSLVRPAVSDDRSTGCVNAAFCESPTRETPPRLMVTACHSDGRSDGRSGQIKPDTSREDMYPTFAFPGRSHQNQQLHISLRSDSADADDLESYS